MKRHPLYIVTSDAFAQEKLDHMRILGARLEIVPSEGGRMTEKLTRDMIDAARVIASRTGAYWTDQLANTDQLAAYHALGEEIWSDTGGRIDAFVQSVGTAASLRGTGEALRRRDERIRIVAVEPAESAVLSGGAPGAHKIDGVGAGFVVPSGARTPPTGSSASRPRRRRRWRSASPARKGSSAAPRPAPTSSPRCASRATSGRAPPSSPSCATRA